ncbi:MAG: hypothetical protein AAB391_03675 [Patescibacteria group bacterium]
MRKKSSHKALLAVSFAILCFPVLLWRDSVHVVTKSIVVPHSPLLAPASSPVATTSDDVTVLHGGSSAKLYLPGMPIVSEHLGVAASSAVPSPQVGLAASAILATSSQKSIIANPAATPLSIGSFAATPGFGGGGAGSTEGGSSGLGSGGGSSSASGRDFDDETCPLVSVSNPPQP